MHTIELHTKADFQAMHRAGQLAAAVLDMITGHINPGVSTAELDQICHDYITSHGATPAPLNYRGFPKSTCISVNHVVCHGIPSERKRLRSGDIVNVDVTVILEGWHGDSSRMYAVGGKTPLKAQRLMDVTYDCLMRGIEAVRPGRFTGDIGFAIQSLAESQGFSVVRDFCGHGIGRKFHAPPSVLHYGNPGEGVLLREGMFFTIEPMINIGTPQVRLLKDSWTAVTKDRSLSAQFEHTIGVTNSACEIFTLSPQGLHCPPYNTAPA